jgi:hypothetical protein
MGFSRNRMPVGMDERQRAVQEDIARMASIKKGSVDEGTLRTINSEEFSFARKSDIPNEAVIAAAQKAANISPIASSGMTLNPEIEAIVNRAKGRLSAIPTIANKVTSDVFTTSLSEPTSPRIALDKTSMKDDLEKRKANLVLKRNAKMKQMEWSKEGNLKVEVADINREIKKLDSQIQGI